MSRSDPPSDSRVGRGDIPISPEELAAVVAAVEAVWPRPVVEEPAPARSPWRFSGRWWQPNASVATSRRRPSGR